MKPFCRPFQSNVYAELAQEKNQAAHGNCGTNVVASLDSVGEKMNRIIFECSGIAEDVVPIDVTPNFRLGQRTKCDAQSFYRRAHPPGLRVQNSEGSNKLKFIAGKFHQEAHGFFFVPRFLENLLSLRGDRIAGHNDRFRILRRDVASLGFRKFQCQAGGIVIADRLLVNAARAGFVSDPDQVECAPAERRFGSKNDLHPRTLPKAGLIPVRETPVGDAAASHGIPRFAQSDNRSK